jgi:multidrug efflux pump subunit AcrB
MKKDASLKGPISWMAQNPVTSNLLMVALLVSGLISVMQIKKEVFPDFQMDTIVVQVAYPGASPVEVERGILLSIEEQVRSIEGVKRVDSVASEGSGQVLIELQTGTDLEKALMDVKNGVDRITSFPLEAEEPMVALLEHKRGVMDLVLYGDLTDKQLRELAENVRDRLLQLPGVSVVDLGGTRPFEISIEVPSETLRQHNLTLSAIADKVRRTAIERPGGGIKAASGEILLRIDERREGGREFENVPVMYGKNGQPVTLADIATIRDGFSQDDESYARFNEKPAVFLSVYSLGDESPGDVARTVRAFAEKLENELPSSVRTAFWNDRAQLFEGRLNLLLKNSGLGLILVLVVLGLLLEPKLAFWVAMGIPMSFLGAFFLLPAFGISLNMISMFAFMVTLGMVVDDAIVVGENIYHLRKKGISPIKASIHGAKEMATPIFFSIATTMAAFAPLLFIPGRIGKIQFAIPIIVMLVLAISLIESFFILPNHLAHTRLLSKNGATGRIGRMQQAISNGLENFIEHRYRPFLTRTLHHRWLTVIISVSLLLVSIGLFTGGRVKYIDFPGGDQDEVAAQAVLPYGVDISQTEAVMKRLVRSAQATLQKFGGDNTSLGILSTIGIGRRDATVSSNNTSVSVLLVPLDDRHFSSKEFAAAWREELGPVSGLESLGFSSTRHGLDRPIDFIISHGSIPILETIASEVADHLADFEGVKDVDDGIAEGKPQWNFTLTEEGSNAGLTVAEIGDQLRASFYGAEVLRQQRGRNEVKVMVRLPEAERKSIATVENMLLRTPTGKEIPLFQAATVSKGYAYKSIARTNGQRTLQIQADVDEKIVNAKEVEQELFNSFLPELKQRYPGFDFSLRGRAEEFKGFRDFILMGIIVALIAIYALIAIPLKSYLQPLLVVMAAIPFGFMGAVLAHFVFGMPISMFSLMGIIALGGVVVNGSIVFVTTANDLRLRGETPMDAAIQAGCRRFRPILLTTATTFFGLAPIIFETSPEAQMMIPMAVSLGFGILVSTFFILLLVPSLFLLVEHLKAHQPSEERLTNDVNEPVR